MDIHKKPLSLTYIYRQFVMLIGYIVIKIQIPTLYSRCSITAGVLYYKFKNMCNYLHLYFSVFVQNNIEFGKLTIEQRPWW
jgi:hypothetical protein